MALRSPERGRRDSRRGAKRPVCRIPAGRVWQDQCIAVALKRQGSAAADARPHELTSAAAEFFEAHLWESGKTGRAHDALADKGLNEKVIRAFGVGYAPVGPHDLIDHLEGLGYSPAEMLDAGLGSLSSRGRIHVRFQSRIMFPVRDRAGHVLGFAGLSTHLGPSWPLWVFSPDTGLYRRSEAVFGLDRAARKISSTGVALIRRDCLEVLAAHQEGRTNAVAVHTGGVTPEQIEAIGAGVKGGADALELDLAPGVRTESSAAAEPAAGRAGVPSADAAPGPEPRHLERKKLALVIATGLTAMNTWTGAPLLALWIGSHSQAGQVLSARGVLIVLAVLGVMEYLLAIVLTWLSAKYDELTGRPRLAGLTSPWHRAKRGDRVQDIRARYGISPPERIVAFSVIAAVIALEFWFFFYAGAPF